MQNHKFLGGLVGVRLSILILLLFAAVDSAPQAIPSANVNKVKVNDNLVSFDPVVPRSPSAPTMPTAQEAYGKLPLYFEANGGKTNERVRFLSRGTNHTLFLTSTEAVLVLTRREQMAHDKREKRGKASGTVLRMAFLRANPHPSW
jgi:hypothetical protein